MNDVKKHWFYKLCVKQCIKDFVWIILGILFGIIGVWLIATGGGIFSILLFVGLAAAMIIMGADAVFVKLPNVKKTIEAMDTYEYENLGDTAPQCMHKTFYLTKGYLCTPVDYAMIPYKDITGMNVRQHLYKGQNKGGYLDLDLNGGAEKKTLHVSDRRFVENSGRLLELIEQGKNASIGG